MDFELDETGDLKISNGDFVFSDATLQHQKDLLIFEKGELKESLLTGVGIMSFSLTDGDYDVLIRDIQEEFEKDGLTIEKLSIDSNYNIDYKATYKQNERR